MFEEIISAGELIAFRGTKKNQLQHLHRKQDGACCVCREQVDLQAIGPDAPCRFRAGAFTRLKGRARPKRLAHVKCAHKRSSEIQNSISVEQRREASGAFPLSAQEMSEVLYRHGHGVIDT